MTDSNDFHPETLLCFTAGVSAQDIEKATQVFNEADSGTVALHAVAVSPSLLGMPVGTALEGLRAGIKPPDFDVSVPGPGGYRSAKCRAGHFDLVRTGRQRLSGS